MFTVVNFLLVCVFVHAKREHGKMHRVSQFEYAKTCEGVPNALHCYDVRRHMDQRGGIAIDADCYIDRGVSSWKEAFINITVCHEVVSTNNCEYFQTWKFTKNVCATAVDSDTPWATLVSSIQPPLYCPVKPGNYTCRDAHLDPEKMAVLPISLDNKIFIVRISLFDQDNILHSCVDIAFRFMRVRA